jgi:hypothetical protein
MEVKKFLDKLYPVFTSTYDSLINGGVKYSEYNLKRSEMYR